MEKHVPRLHVLRDPRGQGRGDLWVAEGTIAYDGGSPSFAVSILEIRGDRIARESIYVAEGWEAPEWRARWRSL